MESSEIRRQEWESACNGSVVCFNIFIFNGSVTGGSVGEIVHNNVVDGSDSDPAGAGVCFGGFYDVAYNAFRYTSQCIPGQFHVFHDNLYEYFYENGHSNVLEMMAESSPANAVYNNVLRHIETLLLQAGEWDYGLIRRPERLITFLTT